MKRFRKSTFSFLALVLSACGGMHAEDYCAPYETMDEQAWNRCIGHFNAQQNAFRADEDMCETIADLTYPQSSGTYTRVEPVISATNASGHYALIESARPLDDVAPDRAITAGRQHIVGLCMYRMGWNSARDWQAGRHPVGQCTGTTGKKPKRAKITVSRSSHPHLATAT